MTTPARSNRPSVAPTTFPEALRRLRAVRDLKQSVLAMRLGVHVMTVSRWERGKSWPTLRQQIRLCEVLKVSAEELCLSGSPASGVVVVAGLDLSELVFTRVDRERLAMILEHSWPADTPLLAGLEAAADELSACCETQAPDAVLPKLRGTLRVLQELLSRPQAPALEGRLHALGSRVAELAGFASFVAGQRPDAYNYYAQAEALGREAGSGELVAVVLTAKSRMYSRTARGHGDPERGIALLEAAELSAGPAAPPPLRAWVHGRRCEEYAELGEDLASRRDLERAYDAMHGASASGCNLFSTLDSAWLDAYAGARALKLGHATEAVAIYEAVLKRTDPRLVWERAVALTHLATAWALEGEMKHACVLLTQAVEMASATGNTSGLMMALRVREHQLAKWRSEPCVRQVDELFRSVTL